MLIWINAPYMCAGVVTRNKIIVNAAPILRWSIGKSSKQFLSWVTRKGFKYKIIREKLKVKVKMEMD
jgi:hypothetical protein